MTLAIAAVMFMLVISGIAFKISAVPFHFWSPDVYQAAPFPVTAFFSVVPKAAGFFLATFILEDVAAVGAGLLLASGEMSWPTAFL